MENRKFLPYVAFVILCFTFGTSYALVSLAIKRIDSVMLSSLRMLVAAFGAFTIFCIEILLDPPFYRHIRQSISSSATSVPKSMFCGIITNGLPHSLITLAQRSVTSVAVQISQPCVSLFSLFSATLLLPDEKFSMPQLYCQLLSVFGTVLTSIPTLSGNDKKDTIYFDYFLLIISTFLFGFGTVYIKYSQPKANHTLLCMFQLTGAALYTFLYAIFIHGFDGYLYYVKEIDLKTGIIIVILGIVFTCQNSFLFVYVVRELGAVTAGYANVGQIIVGVITGVVFLNEWSNYTYFDIAISIVGLIILAVSIRIGFKIESSIVVKRSSSESVPFL